jgi:hypothetical protein
MKSKVFIMSFLSLLALWSSFSSAAIIESFKAGKIQLCDPHGGNIGSVGGGCSLFWTTSAPTMILADSNIDFTSTESRVRFVAEANGDAELFLIKFVAKELSSSEEAVAQAILVLDNLSKEISLENIQSVID